MDEALDWYKKAVAKNPNDFEAHYNIGVVLNNRGNAHAALEAYQRVVAINPDFVKAYNNIGNALSRLGRVRRAVACFREAIERQPDRLAFWQNYVRALGRVQLTDVGLLGDDYTRCVFKDGLNLNAVAGHLTVMLKQAAPIQPLLTLFKENHFKRLVGLMQSGAALKMLNHPTLVRIMKSCILADMALEQLLAFTRRTLLYLAMNGELPNCLNKSESKLLFALAHQCFLNEYIYPQEEAETALAAALRGRVETSLATGSSPSIPELVLLSTYFPLYTLGTVSHIVAVATSNQNPNFSQLVLQQIVEPMTEEKIKDRIEAITPITDAVSLSVRDQYETNPYPRWITAPTHTPRMLGDILIALFPQLGPIKEQIPESPLILIAGCGTGQQAVECAARYKNARIVAVDISRASLAYALRKTKELKLGNIDFFQGDILELHRSNLECDLIISSGVLHHMAVPFDGLNVLAGLLKPGGFMKLGFYSEIARLPITRVQRIIAENGYGSSPDDIRKARQTLFFESGSTNTEKIFRLSDFYSLSMCRDLLFHVQEHRYSLLQIKEMLSRIQLNFLGFEFQNTAVLTEFQSQGTDHHITSLDSWHNYEINHPETFINMYQFWVRKPNDKDKAKTN